MLLLLAFAVAVASSLRFALWAASDDPSPARTDAGEQLNSEDMDYFDWNH